MLVIVFIRCQFLSVKKLWHQEKIVIGDTSYQVYILNQCIASSVSVSCIETVLYNTKGVCL